MFVVGRGPSMSNAILCHTYRAKGMVFIGALVAPYGFPLAHVMHDCTQLRTSVAVLGQLNRLLIQAMVFSYPRGPASL